LERKRRREERRQDKRAKREARRTTKGRRQMSDSQSPQSKRGSSQDYEQFSKGESLDGIKQMQKSGGPETPIRGTHDSVS
jgi:hypothetical protein